MEDKKIKVIPIKREGSWLSEISKNHDGIILFSGTAVTYTVPKVGDNLVNVFEDINKEEIKWLEDELGVDPGSLSPNKIKDNFWLKNKLSRVRLTKDGITLNLHSAVDFVKFLVLKANKEYIASSWETRFDKGSYKFAIVDSDVEVQEGSKKTETLRDAYMQFGKIEDSETKMKAVLRIYLNDVKSNVKVPTKTSKEFLRSEIGKIIETSAKKFLAIIKDTDFNIKADISEALAVGYIIKIGKAKYQFKDMIDDQFTYDELVDFLKSKENSDRYLKLKEAIK